MKIQGGNNTPIRPQPAPDAREREQIRREEKNTIGQPERPRDRVEISPEAREKLEKRLENLLDKLKDRRRAHIQPEPNPRNAEPVTGEPARVQPIGKEPAHVQPIGKEPAHVQPIGKEPAHVQPMRPEPAKLQPIEGRNSEPVEGRNAQPADGGFSTDPIWDRSRLREVRDKILSGAYDLDQVISVVARRILERRDV
jgi:hypothetical protein